MNLADAVKNTFSYNPATGRLTRVRAGRGARVGVEVGAIGELGHRRAYFMGRNRMTAHMVWAIHHGCEPSGILRHVNGDNADDRIENLELLKQQLPVAYQSSGSEFCEMGRLPKGITTGVYEIFCTTSGRRYVGSALNFESRWRKHFTQLEAGVHHSPALQRAWSKHGRESFVFRVLEQCHAAELIVREQGEFDRSKPKYNCRPDAGSQLGYRHTEDSRKRMSASRPKDFSPMTGKRHTEETRRRISQTKTGVKLGSYSAERVSKTAESMRRAIGALSEEQVRTIRRLNASGKRHRDVSNVVGCSYSAVADVVRKRTFNWVI